MVGNCRKILTALATVGEVALIDEATGYQYHRAPNALQELIAKLLRQSCATWERRFHPNFYRAVYRLFGWTRRPRAEPATHRWADHLAVGLWAGTAARTDRQIRARKGLSHKHHQWLNEQGLAHLESRIHAVTAIARSSANFRDFTRRCESAFEGSPFQLGLLANELAEVA